MTDQPVELGSPGQNARVYYPELDGVDPGWAGGGAPHNSPSRGTP